MSDLERRISEDLRDLTERAERTGHTPALGFLGGAYGYGTHIETPTWTMHPYCWCEGTDCPWCLACACPWDGTHIYELADGTHVDGDTYYDTPDEQRGPITPIPEKLCDNCRNPQEPAPNFHHKPTGVKVRWYKYIGRGMEIECPSLEAWEQAIADARKTLTGAP